MESRAQVKQRFIPKVPGTSWGAMVVLWLVFAMNSSVRELFNRTQTYMVQEFSITPEASGLYVTLMSIAMGILPIFLSSWSDKMGQGWARKKSMFWIMLGYMIFTLLVGFNFISTGIVVVVVLLFIRNLFAGVGESLECTAIVEWWPREARGFAAGLHHTGYPWGTFITGIILAAILGATNGNWRLLFIIVPVITIPIWIIYWRFSTKKTYDKYEKRALEMGLTPTLDQPDTADGQVKGAGSIKACFKNANVVVATLITICALVMFFGINYWMNPYLAFVAHYDFAVAAAYSLIYTITGGLGQIIWGRLSDYVGRRRSLMFCFAWLAIWVLLLPRVALSLGWLIGVQLAIGFCTNAIFALVYAFVQDSAPKGSMGTAMGLNVAGSVIAAFTPYILGALIAVGGGWMQMSGYQSGVYFMCALMVVGFLLMLLFSHETTGRLRGRDWALVSYASCGIEDNRSKGNPGAGGPAETSGGSDGKGEDGDKG